MNSANVDPGEASIAELLENIPEELRRRTQWVVWRLEERGGTNTKVPYIAGGVGKASSTDSLAWRTFEEALQALETGRYNGVGFVLSSSDPYAGVDLDGCREPDTGRVEPWARKIVAALDSYTEVSPSGTGLHVFVKATLAKRKTRKGPVEMYESSRYFTLTGEHLDGTPKRIYERQDVLERLRRHIFKSSEKPAGETNDHRPRPMDVLDEELLALAMRAKNGDKFSRLWRGDTSEHGGDESRADLALCSHLGYWTDGDTERMDRLFRQSGLYRDKWNRPAYRERTVRKVLEGKTEFYQGIYGEKASLNGNGLRLKKPTGKQAAPTHDELRDRWIDETPHHAHGLGDWRRYEAGIWPTVSETLVKADISKVIEKAKPEDVKPTASILSSVTELTRIKVYIPTSSGTLTRISLSAKTGRFASLPASCSATNQPTTPQAPYPTTTTLRPCPPTGGSS